MTNRFCVILLLLLFWLLLSIHSHLCVSITTDYIVLTISCFGALKCLSCNFHRIKTNFIKTQACTFVKIKLKPEPISRLLRTTWSQPEDVRRFPYMLQITWNTFHFKVYMKWNFIGLFESAFKDKTIAVYRLWISGLDPKLWRSEVVKIVNFRVKKWQEIGHKINKNWSNLWRHNVYMSNRWLFKWLYPTCHVSESNEILYTYGAI